MLYVIESDTRSLKGKQINSATVQFNLDETIEHEGCKYTIRYLTHVFNKVGAYQYTKVGLDR